MSRIFLSLSFLFVQLGLFAQRGGKYIFYSPKTYFNKFSNQSEPVLHLRSGDTVSTESVDAGGVDKFGVKVARRGNPLTGPFFIDGAESGDILAVRLQEVRLTR